ncbi:hypothetical protein DMC47_38615 [Nostoc sp. 3335mG]|nr:hypothetical protein DMC47_38615 [Nostoc sp. 3335mG]
MKIAFGILLLAVMGPGFLTTGIWTLRSRAWRDGVPLLELAIDRAIGEEPPERTTWDRRFARFNAWAQIILGSFFTVCLVAVLFTQFAPE